MGHSPAATESVRVEATLVRERVAHAAAVAAALLLFLAVAELLAEGGAGLGRVHNWLALLAAALWGGLWALSRWVSLAVAALRAVEVGLMLAAITAVSLAMRRVSDEPLGRIAEPFADLPPGAYVVLRQRLSAAGATLAVALALVSRAALVPSSPRRNAATTALVGLPLSIVWLAPGELLGGAGEGEIAASAQVAAITAFWWGIVVAVCYSVTRVVHGLRVAMLEARQLGQYTLEEKLGEGGMGEVYRARHSRLRRPTAIKLLNPEVSSEQAIARFESEVQLTAELTHPNTITIFDYGRTPEGIFYYAMEHLKGATLAQVVAASGAQPAARVIKILEQAAGALQEAHGLGLIHRDIKPANIMLSPLGIDPDTVKVLDFGLVRPVHRGKDAALTEAGSMVGTPMYMAPEAIASGGQAGPQSDLYALGAVGYYLLTGDHVFSGSTSVEVYSHHLHTQPPPPSERLGRPLPKDLEAVVLACLEKRPEARPQGAAELIELLSRCADHGKWTAADAERWWEEYRRPLRDLRATARPAPSGASTQTLTVA